MKKIFFLTMFLVISWTIFGNNFYGNRSNNYNSGDWYKLITDLKGNDPIVSLSLINRIISKNQSPEINKKIYFIKGMLHKKKKQTREMIDSFKNAVKYNDYLADYALYELSLYYDIKKLYSKSLSYLSQLTRNYTSSVLYKDACILAANVAIKSNKNSIASIYINKLRNLCDTPESAFEAGILCYKVKDYEQSLNHFKKVVKLNHHNNYKIKALNYIEKIILNKTRYSYKTRFDNLVYITESYLDENYFRSALKILKKLPYSAEKHYYTGLAYFNLGQMEKSTRYFKTVITKYKNSKYASSSIYYRANANLQLGYDKFGEEKMLSFIKLNPFDSLTDNAYLALADYYFDKNQTRKALRLLKKIRLTYPNDDTYYDALWTEANYYRKHKNYSKATEIFSTLVNSLSDKDKKIKALYWRGKTHIAQQKYLSAANDFLEVIAVAPMSYYTYRSTVKLKNLYSKISSFTKRSEFNYCLNKSEYCDALTEIENVLNNKNSNRSYYSNRDFSEFTYDNINWSANFPTISAKEHFYKYYVLNSLKKYEYAIDELKYVMEYKPNEPKYIYNLSLIMTEAKRKTEALDLVEKMIDKFGDRFNLMSMPENLKKILYPQYYWNCVIDYATLNNLDPYLVFALIREESRFKERAYSRVGARGLMQIMPGTGRWISRQLSMSYYKTRDLFVPRINIKMGTWYLSYLKHKHNNNLMLTLASYNGGFMNVMKWVKKFKTKDIDEFVELIPFRETKNYVKKVMKSFNIYKQIYDNGYNIELTSNDSSSSYSDTIQY